MGNDRYDLADSAVARLQGRQQDYAYYSLAAAEKSGLKGISRLPFS
jgi:hypothetical protein